MPIGLINSIFRSPTNECVILRFRKFTSVIIPQTLGNVNIDNVVLGGSGAIVLGTSVLAIVIQAMFAVVNENIGEYEPVPHPFTPRTRQ